MADGTSKRAGERPLLQECRWCAAGKGLHHSCAFLTGVFDSGNWCCAALEQLEPYCSVLEGDELDVMTMELPDLSMLVMTRRTGESRRIRTAVVVTPKSQVVPLRLSHVESILNRSF